MKIILATESFLPNISGVSVATDTLANNLIDAGHSVSVFCPGSENKTYQDKAFSKYPVIRFKSITNPFRKGFRITSASKKELGKMVEEIAPDLIHLQDVASIGLALRDIGKELNIPVIITNHFSLEFALSYVKFKWLRPIARSLLVNYLVNFHNKCDLVITPTETIAKQIRSWKVKTPVVGVSNGIFHSRFLAHLNKDYLDDFRRRFHLPDNKIVLYTGRIDKDKSVDVIIRSIPEVVKETNAHFVFAGTGDLLPAMENLAETLGVRKEITFLGKLNRESTDFVALYKSANVFAIASLIETQSLVTLEAMSSGLPIVAVNFNALPELVKNGENGFLFRPGKSTDLADKLIKILKDNEMASTMGKKSIEISAKHEMKKAFHHLLLVYKEVIEQKKAGKVYLPPAYSYPY